MSVPTQKQFQYSGHHCNRWAASALHLLPTTNVARLVTSDCFRGGETRRASTIKWGESLRLLKHYQGYVINEAEAHVLTGKHPVGELWGWTQGWGLSYPCRH